MDGGTNSVTTNKDIVLSIDVEDWFHVLDLKNGPCVEAWEGLPSRVERNFMGLLDLLDEYGARVTCFFLGWIAQRFPGLVREAVRRGHEIASHSFRHKLVYEMSPEDFHSDTYRARALLQDISGQPINGYRAPGFSVTSETPWFFSELVRVGHTYDASLFPASRGHGGAPRAHRAPKVMRLEGGTLVVFPMTVANVGPLRLCFFGGGYFRLFPYSWIRKMTTNVQREGLPVLFYLHPRDCDPNQPRIPMPFRRRFKCYVNLDRTIPKMRRLLTDFRAISCEECIASL